MKQGKTNGKGVRIFGIETVNENKGKLMELGELDDIKITKFFLATNRLGKKICF